MNQKLHLESPRLVATKLTNSTLYTSGRSLATTMSTSCQTARQQYVCLLHSRSRPTLLDVCRLGAEIERCLNKLESAKRAQAGDISDDMRAQW